MNYTICDRWECLRSSDDIPGGVRAGDGDPTTICTLNEVMYEVMHREERSILTLSIIRQRCLQRWRG